MGEGRKAAAANSEYLAKQADNKYMGEREVRRRKSTKSSKKTNSLFALGIFVLGILVIGLLFIVNKDNILTNLKETNFFDRVFGSTPDFVQNHISGELASDEDELIGTSDSEIIIQMEKPSSSTSDDTVHLFVDDIIASTSSEQVKKETEDVVVTPVETIPPVKKEEVQEQKKESEDKIVKTEPKVESKIEPKTEIKTEPKVEKETIVSTVQYTDLTLCFIEVNSDGIISRKNVKRNVPKNDSPLTTAINLLLEGPDSGKSQEKELMTLIPSGTKLLSAKVTDGVAYLNFNEYFERNPDGVEGYIYSLMQVVYTATSFSTVKSVQFLIEGQQKDYLGDGQWIGSPLSRYSF